MGMITSAAFTRDDACDIGARYAAAWTYSV